MNPKLTKTIILGTLLLGGQQARALDLDFGSLPGAQLSFIGTGDTFQFLNKAAGLGAGNSFQINLSDGVGDSVGDFGKITGIFTIGAITVAGGVQTAPVTASPGAKIIIHGGIGTDFIGNIHWVQIRSEGTAGNLDLNGEVNITGITYSGTQADLIALKGTTSTASAVVGFTFLKKGGKSLLNLTANGAKNSTSFTGDLGSVQVPDGGSTAMLLGLAFAGFGAIARRKA